jgi:hypothetical protein
LLKKIKWKTQIALLVQDQPQATSGRPVEKIIKTKNEWEQG